MRPEPIVRAATREDAIAIAPRLRIRDCMAEIWAREGLTHEQAVLRTFNMSVDAWTWEVDGKPACMFGVIRQSMIGGKSIGWLLSTEAVESNYRTFWRGSKRFLRALIERNGVIEGFCDTGFEASARWLKRLGFVLGDPVTVSGLSFHPFKVT